MHLLALHLAALAHLPVMRAHDALAAAGLHGFSRFLVRRLLLHALLRSGGWILVVVVVVVLLAVTQISRRRR